MIWSAIPWKLVGVGGLALAVIVASLFLINYGQKLEQALNEVDRLEVELEKANTNTEKCVKGVDEMRKSALKWQLAATEFEIAYLEELAKVPTSRIVYRSAAAVVPVAVPTGNCDLAAVGAWNLLRDAQVVGREP